MAERENQAAVQGLNTSFQAREIREGKGCVPASIGKSGCGSPAGESELAPEIWEKVDTPLL